MSARTSRCHDAERPRPCAWPSASVGPNALPPIPIHASDGTAGAAKVCLTAYGASRSMSKAVNHSEPVGGWPGRWWVV